LVSLEPLLLGVLLVEPLLLPELEPMPLLLGVLLELPLLLGELLLGVLLLGVLPPELEPALLKCASHSSFDTCPSPFLSTEVKLGALELAPLDAPDAPLELLPEELGVELEPEALGVELDPEAPEELLPVALGEDLSLSAPVEDEPELWAMDAPASANNAAAVAVVINFNFMRWFLLQGKMGRTAAQTHATLVPKAFRGAGPWA
jgi:hypothetical protein